MLFRLYIGSNNKTHRLESKKAIAVVSKRFEGFTVSTGSGYWQGKPEKTLLVNIETSRQAKVFSLSRELCRELNQQAVGVAKIGKMAFIS